MRKLSGKGKCDILQKKRGTAGEKRGGPLQRMETGADWGERRLNRM